MFAYGLFTSYVPLPALVLTSASFSEPVFTPVPELEVFSSDAPPPGKLSPSFCEPAPPDGTSSSGTTGAGGVGTTGGSTGVGGTTCGTCSGATCARVLERLFADVLSVEAVEVSALALLPSSPVKALRPLIASPNFLAYSVLAASSVLAIASNVALAVETVC